MILAAGSDTTSRNIASILYNLLANPQVLEKLQRELDRVMPDPRVLASCRELGQIEYFVCRFSVLDNFQCLLDLLDSYCERRHETKRLGFE